jgi:hypothetical protein
VRKYLRDRKKRKKARQREKNMTLANNIKNLLSKTTSPDAQGVGGDRSFGLGTTVQTQSINKKSEKYFKEKFDLNGGVKFNDNDDDSDDDDDEGESEDEDNGHSEQEEDDEEEANSSNNANEQIEIVQSAGDKNMVMRVYCIL